ncbi:MAG: membrane protein [Burkholderiales bacterium]|nr:MAG: membrane protein [Burkholderiales bacterium]
MKPAPPAALGGLLLLLVQAAWGEAPPGPAPGTVMLQVENDWPFATDRQYTGGIELVWFSGEGRPGDGAWPGWLPGFSSLRGPKSRRHWTLALGQQAYTPDDLSATDPPRSDRPYAGWTYVRLGVTGWDSRRLDAWRLALGVVGPSSGAEAVQSWLHDLTGSQKGRGWDFQLGDEPGVVMHWERRWRAWAGGWGDGWGWNLVPAVGANLGNVSTAWGLQLELRFGYRVPPDFGEVAFLNGGPVAGPARRTASGYSLYGVLAPWAEAVARNVFLDGNTWKDSRRVDKKPFVAGLAAGMGLRAGELSLSLLAVYRTRDFETQPHDHHLYAVLALSYPL